MGAADDIHHEFQTSCLLTPPAEHDVRAAVAPRISDGGAHTLSEIIHVPLTKGRVAIIDASDAWVLRWKWSARKDCRGNTYAERRIEGGGGKRISLHRAILGAECLGKLVDHKDGNGLNNRRGNLRVATHAVNARNVGKLCSTNTSGYFGVSQVAKSRRWRAAIMVDGKTIRLGTYDTAEEAAAARVIAEKEYWGTEPQRAAYHEEILQKVTGPIGARPKPKKRDELALDGVVWHERTQVWRARFSVKGKKVELGEFVNLSDANRARRIAEKIYAALTREAV